MGYLFIFGTISFTVYGQLILKWKIDQYGSLPELWYEKLIFLFQLLLNPWILSGFLSAFVASLFWMAAMTKFNISYAYPFMSLSFILVFVLSVLLFGEPITGKNIIGISFIVLGIIIMR